MLTRALLSLGLICLLHLVRDKRVYRHAVNNDGLTPYELGRKQSTIAVQRYEGTDGTFAEERQHFDSNNRVEGTEDKPADQNKQDTKKASLKDYERRDIYGAMMTLSILYSYACPRESLRDHFTGTRPMQPRKKETKTRIGNLLVVAVLVTGSSACYWCDLWGSHSIATIKGPAGYERLLYAYLSCDVWALCLSLVAALILLRANFTDAKFGIFAVGFSVVIVSLAILKMFQAFIYAVTIALLGSDDAWSKIIITLEVFMGLCTLVFIVIPWILPSGGIPELSHYLYYKYFWFLFYTYEWLPYKIDIRKHSDSKSMIRSHCAVAEFLVSAVNELAYFKNKAEKKPELLYFRDKEIGNALHFAPSQGNAEEVRFPSKELSASESNEEGNLPILVACIKGHVKVVEELLKQWSDPMEFVKHKRQNILHVVAVNGQEKAALRKEFGTLLMKAAESVNDYFGRTLIIANKMRIHGECMKDVVIIEKILRSMTPKYDYVVCSIKESNDLDILSIDELQSSLLVHEQRISRHVVIEERALQTTYGAQQGGRDGGRNNYRGRGRGKFGFDKTTIECYNYGDRGHFQWECPRKAWDQKVNYAETREEMLLMAYVNLQQAETKHIWFLDSRCSNYMCG
ncbi:PREDICTED: uncharacterized protein LOC105115158 [Populus euphratica]|uniref:Uncharacterized protein LOC105115158 n=1 Tax=Populus euphratica TaxID=75702 RepID=A0AAJ6TG90_POPEU|nr:PREDICTED: uncharacterized protein LOC105115158 [Populus euphratica]